MKLSIITLMLVQFLSFRAYSSIIKVKSEKVPLELKVLIESLELHKDNTDKIKVQLSQVEEIILKNPDEALIKYLVKIESSKFVLRWFAEKLNPIVFDVTPDNFEKKLALLELSPFSKWLIAGVVTDFKNLKRDPGFAAFSTAYRNNRRQNTPEFLRLEKKIILLSPWIHFLYQSGEDEINFELFKVQSSLFKKLLEKMNLYHLLVHNYPKIGNSPNNLSFFDFIEAKENESGQDLSEKIAKIEVPAGKDSKDNKTNNWTPSEDVKKLLPNYPQFNPNYVAPEKLPEPVNDWFLDL